MSTPSQSTALILFAHGARDPEWARPAQQVLLHILQQQPSRWVKLAFLEFMTPSLESAVHEAVEVGITTLKIVPLFLAQGGHLKQDVPVLVDKLQQRYPELNLELLTPVGESRLVQAAIAEYALAAV